MTDITLMLSAIEAGDPAAAEQLLPLVYVELRKLAAQKMARESTDHTLQATALVHEAYLRLVNGDDIQPWNSRGHFFAAAAESMRRILVENARRKRRMKHGGDFTRGEFHDSPVIEADCREDLLALDEALAKLALEHRPAAKLVQLRYFAGLTMAEIAATMEISERSAARLWTYARAWLLREIQGSDDSGKNS